MFRGPGEPTPIGYAFYNVGVQNDEVCAKTWPARVDELEQDVRSIVSNGNVEAIFLCGFGNMLVGIEGALSTLQAAADHGGVAQPVEVVKEFFNSMLGRIGLTDWEAFTDAPHIALVEFSSWEVKVQESYNCSQLSHRAQHLLLKHAVSERQVRVFNNHSPTSLAKKDNIKKPS